MADGKDDGFCRQGADGILDGLFHEFPDDGVVGARIGDAALQIGAFKGKVVRVDALLLHLLANLFGKFSGFQTLDLKGGTRHVNRAIGNKVTVAHGFVVTVLAGGNSVLAVEQAEGVVVDEIGGGGGKPEVDGIEVIENGFVPLIDGAVALVADDEVVVTG